ncbi:MAG: hypothetical protein D3922_11470 [Candidatus Electrothrix sp. AR1]|nr:hypothetical protein [Candidatus Electrothrix sp. AR1]
MKEDSKEIRSEKAIYSLVETIKKSPDILSGVGDVAIEVLNSESSSGIPIVSWAVNILKMRDEWRLIKMKKNILSFLSALQSSDTEKIQTFLDKAKEDKEFAEEFIDTFLTLIYESEKPVKLKLTANLLDSLSKGSVEKKHFLILLLVIHSSSVPGLESVCEFVEENEHDYPFSHPRPPQEALLMSTGLSERFGTNFRLSRLGIILYNHAFKGSKRPKGIFAQSEG